MKEEDGEVTGYTENFLFDLFVFLFWTLAQTSGSKTKLKSKKEDDFLSCLLGVGYQHIGSL